MRSKEKQFVRLAVFIIILSLFLTSGCISNSENIIGELLGSFAEGIKTNPEPYSIDISELTFPTVPIQEPFSNEERPWDMSTYSPGFEVSSAYYYTQFYENSNGIVGVRIKNLGEERVFIYKFGLFDINTDEWYGIQSGIKLLPGEEKDLGLISVDIPDNTKEVKLKLGLSILAETPDNKWHDYDYQLFDEFTADVIQKPEKQDPEFVSNPEGTFEILNEKVDPHDIEVRKMAATSAKCYPGAYNIYQICSLFDDTKNNIQYISDPRGTDVWSPPCDTLEVEAGDCDDYAILLASLIESIGGTTRVYLTDTHAFAAVYIGDEENTDQIVEAIGNYYGSVPVYYTTDEYGSWLMLDPTSNVYPGGLPGGTAPIDNGWTFTNTTQVTVIDIAP